MRTPIPTLFCLDCGSLLKEPRIRRGEVRCWPCAYKLLTGKELLGYPHKVNPL
jgi:hypothetical protein